MYVSRETLEFSFLVATTFIQILFYALFAIKGLFACLYISVPTRSTVLWVGLIKGFSGKLTDNAIHQNSSPHFLLSLTSMTSAGNYHFPVLGW